MAMQTQKPHILILAGTSEARSLITYLHENFNLLDEMILIASLAGMSSAVDNPEFYGSGVKIHQGGFGGIDGLKTYLIQNHITHILDVTHPYAVKIKTHAFKAAQALDLPHYCYYRPPWQPAPQDQWRNFKKFSDMALALPSQARVFAAAGHTALTDFLHRKDCNFFYRSLNCPQHLPDHITFLPFNPHEQGQVSDSTLLKYHRITHLICKNSGGAQGFEKIEAARTLQLPVWLLERPKITKIIPLITDWKQFIDQVTGLLQT